MQINDQFVALVSGGPDSMAMLDILQKRICAVCHVNYGMRRSSFRDEEIVKNYCKEINKPFFCERIKWTKSDGNFQNFAREIRFNLLENVVLSLRAKCGVVAHHLDDFIETALMQLERQSKADFYGIKFINEWNRIKIIHPLLSVRKQQLVDYCLRKSIPFGIDETNSDATKSHRNSVRKQILEFNQEKLNKLIRLINDYNIGHNAERQLSELFYFQWKQMPEIKTILSLPSQIRRRVFYLWLNNANIRYTHAKYRAFINFCLANINNVNKSLRIKDGIWISTRKLKNFFIGNSSQKAPFQFDSNAIVLVIESGNIARN